MIVYAKCSNFDKYVICSDGNPKHILPIGSFDMKCSQLWKHISTIIDKTEEYNITTDNVFVKLGDDEFLGSYLFSEKEEDASMFCQYLNSLLIMHKLGDQ